MATKITSAKYKVARLYMAEPITDEAGITTASWKECPFTLRDDVITIKSDEPETDELYVHEIDTPIDVDYDPKPTTVSGSFVELTEEDLLRFFEGAKLTAGTGVALYGKLKKLSVALKIEGRSGASFVLPRAEGFVQQEIGIGKGGVAKYPFKFTATVAGDKWPADIVYLKG